MVHSWRPYIAGALTGILAIFSVLLSTWLLEKPKYLGASTTLVRGAGIIEKSIAPQHVAENTYYQAKKVRVDWQFMLVVGVVIGAFFASIREGGFRLEGIPPLWEKSFGKSHFRRVLAALLGGMVAAFGARLAGGCPSGHGMSGLMQLSISGFLAMAGFFCGGVAIARMLYRKNSGGEK